MCMLIKTAAHLTFTKHLPFLWQTNTIKTLKEGNDNKFTNRGLSADVFSS